MSESKLKTLNKQLVTEVDRPHIQSVVGKYGRTYYFRHDEFVGKSIFEYGEFSPEECAFIVGLANERPGELVLDVGANLGAISQALVANGSKVEAFEPQPEIFALLEKNCPSIECHNVALGNHAGTAQMPRVDYSKKGNFGGLGIGMGHGLQIQMLTLDSLEYNNVGLIKIDVEGFEELVHPC